MEEDLNAEVHFYTDGACSGNPGPGGWAYVRGDGAERSGYEAATTNNRMELMAPIRALESLARSTVPRVHCYTDSKYVKDGITRWITVWKQNAWRTNRKAPVKNKDLWVRLDALCGARCVEWHWVARNTLPEQARADALARQAIILKQVVNDDEEAT